MRRFFYKLIILSLLGMIVAPFFVKGPSGRPIMAISDAVSMDPSVYRARYMIALIEAKRYLKKHFSKTSDDILDEVTGDRGLTKVYKWKDAKGEWHFDDHESSQFDSEAVSINPDANVMEFEKVKVQAEIEGMANPDDPNNPLEKISPKDDALSAAMREREKSEKGYFDKMTGVLDDAKNVQKVNDDYHKKLMDSMP